MCCPCFHDDGLNRVRILGAEESLFFNYMIAEMLAMVCPNALSERVLRR